MNRTSIVFSQLKAPYGQYSILGNHDYGDYISWDSEQEKHANLEKLKQHHQALGYRLLLDENVEIEKNGAKNFADRRTKLGQGIYTDRQPG